LLAAAASTSDNADASVCLDPRTFDLANILDPLLPELGHQFVACHELVAETGGDNAAVADKAGGRRA
jgi:hypothetical protein